MRRPFHAYATWVRANQSNVKTLESLSRTMSLILSNPNSLIGMEAAWQLPRLLAMLNDGIVSCTHHPLSTPELMGYLTSAVHEVQSLIEILVRQHSTQAFTWKAVLLLQGVKAILKVCAHRQLFLVPWMWDSLKVTVRQAVYGVLWPRGSTRNGFWSDASRSRLPNALTGQSTGPMGVQLVIPRVVSDRRQERQHYGPLRNRDEEEQEAAETIPFTVIDVLGMAMDAFLLVRPMLLVWTAGRIFPYEINGKVGLLPPKPTPSVTAADQTAPVEDHEEAPNELQAISAALQATPAHTLFPSWKWWGVFAAMDAVVVLLARLIRAYRVPVVYITDSPPENTSRALSSDAAGSEEEEVGPASTIPVGANRAFAPEVGAPPVVSRDTLRLQEAIRNMAFSFLRDPFFSAVIKPWVQRHLLGGFLSRIPLLGAMVIYQVTYYVAMQHYSFLYTIGW